MAKKKANKSRKSTKKLSNFGRFAFIFMSLIGIGVMWYLTDLHFSEAGTSSCDLSDTLSCGAVNSSEYSEILGMPVSILGIGYFLGILLASLFRYNRNTLKGIAVVSILFLGPSLYLTVLEFTVIKSICIFCEYSKVLMFAMVFAALFELRPDKFKKGHLREAMIIAVFMAGITFFVQFTIQGDNVPSGKYDEFAQCLTRARCVEYGSATCASCAKQREMFGDAYQYITEIECDPRNPGAETDRCIEKDIHKTPTWIIEDEAGATIYRFETGIQSLQALSQATECDLPVEE